MVRHYMGVRVWMGWTQYSTKYRIAKSVELDLVWFIRGCGENSI